MNNEHEIIEQARLFLQESPYNKLPTIPVLENLPPTHKDAANLFASLIACFSNLQSLAVLTHSWFYTQSPFQEFMEAAKLENPWEIFGNLATLMASAYLQKSPFNIEENLSEDNKQKFASTIQKLSNLIEPIFKQHVEEAQKFSETTLTNLFEKTKEKNA